MRRSVLGRDTLRQHSHNEIMHLPVVVVQSNERYMTYQALCWCSRKTVHDDVANRREAYNIGYIRRRRELICGCFSIFLQ